MELKENQEKAPPPCLSILILSRNHTILTSLIKKAFHDGCVETPGPRNRKQPVAGGGKDGRELWLRGGPLGIVTAPSAIPSREMTLSVILTGVTLPGESSSQIDLLGQEGALRFTGVKQQN